MNETLKKAIGRPRWWLLNGAVIMLVLVALALFL